MASVVVIEAPEVAGLRIGGAPICIVQSTISKEVVIAQANMPYHSNGMPFYLDVTDRWSVWSSSRSFPGRDAAVQHALKIAGLADNPTPCDEIDQQEDSDDCPAKNN